MNKKLASCPQQRIKDLERLAFALDQHAIVSIADKAGRIVYANEKFCEISQYSQQELLGQDHRIVNSGLHPRETFKDMWATIGKGDVWKGELRNRRKNGEFYWVETTIVPFPDAKGRPCQFVSIRTEVTAQKNAELAMARAAEAALEASRIKSEFVATVSHEIRTPINGIVGTAELLRDSGLDAEQRWAVDTITESAEHLLEIVNEILDFSKIEAGKLVIEETDFSLADIVNSVVHLLLAKARHKHLALAGHVDGGVPQALCGDHGRLRQILLNLAENAVKFTACGGVTVSALLEVEDEERACVRFEVVDTGIGISKRTLPGLFQPFIQGDGSTTRNYGGTGLGLSICKNLVEMMGGSIGVHSVEGQGSTFWFTLPFKKAEGRPLPGLAGNAHRKNQDDTYAVDESATRAVGAGTLHPAPALPVLLVEDHPVNLRIAKRLLENFGCDVHPAGNGREALAAIEQMQYALILMDCQMPEMDGFEATAAIRARERRLGLPRIPIIAFTASAMPGDREKCLNVGMDDYLAKPIRTEKLKELLLHWTQGGAEQPATEGRALHYPAPAVDWGFLESLRKEVGEALADVVAAYLDDTPLRIAELGACLAQKDAPTLARIAHTLKSCSLQLGARPLAEAARQLEERVRRGSFDGAAALIAGLDREYEKVQAALAAMPSQSRRETGCVAPPPDAPLILIVDDDREMRLFLSKVMERQGYRVAEAADGGEALSQQIRLHPALILMDCLMPVMDGFEACARLHHQSPETHCPPVLMITGLHDDQSVERAMIVGATDFITKPIYLPVLVSRVRHILGMQEAQRHVKHLAYHDPLTGLPNRALLHDRMHQALAAAKRGEYRLACLFCDLDNFKMVNDSLGHDIGDLLLRACAERIAPSLREGDTLSRLGGDEFALLLPQIATGPAGEDYLSAVSAIAEKILRLLKAPFFIEGHEIHIGGSIGISIYPGDGEDAVTLLKHADIAMYWAKKDGHNGFYLYSSAMNAHVNERLELKNGLHRLLKNLDGDATRRTPRCSAKRNGRTPVAQELSVHYQPQMRLAGVQKPEVFGVEALLRWQHPEKGMVSPAKFIPLAEETGMIVPLGEWVLRQACADAMQWQTLGLVELRVSVNLSARQFKAGNLSAVVLRALADTGLPPRHLDLEITETIAMQDVEQVAATLHELKALGVGISMDDFGTGYCALNYLQRFPIDILKLDQSFVRGIGNGHSHVAIIEAILAMAHALNLKVIAEGVETDEQLEFLAKRGCDMVQGFLFAQPLPAAAMIEWLANTVQEFKGNRSPSARRDVSSAPTVETESAFVGGSRSGKGLVSARKGLLG